MHKLTAGLAECRTDRLSLKRSAGLGLSVIAPLYFGLMSWRYANFSSIIQDDARLHLVWLQRLIDPALFPADAIADYYSAIQPIGFQAVYGLVAALGIEPLAFAKILPLGLALIATVYLYWGVLLIWPVPLSGLLVTLVFNQNIWLKDDLVSATPRAFVYPLFAAFLYYFLRDARGFWLLVLGLQGLFYPQMMLVSLGMLTLRSLGRAMGSRLRQAEVWGWLAALALTVSLLLLFSYRAQSQAGALVSLSEMQTMPEFQAGGRRAYFGVSPLAFIFSGASGLRMPLFPPIIGVGILLPALLWRRRDAADQTPYVAIQAAALGQLLASALILFLLAHLTFPRLYLPSRYSFYSLRFAMAIASGLALTLIAQRADAWVRRRTAWTWRDRLWAALGGGLAIAIVVLPAIPAIVLPCQGWVVGRNPGLYRAIAHTPKDSLVASIAPEVDNVPAFAQRSVLVGAEFALPYHSEFYALMLQRMADLVAAQYSPETAQLAAFIQAYGIDLWLVDRHFAEPDYLLQQGWLMNSSIGDQIAEAVRDLQTGLQPALAQAIPACGILEEDLVLLDAACVAERAQGEGSGE